MKFRTLVFGSIGALLLVVIAAVAFAVSFVVERNARAAVSDAVTNSLLVFEDLQAASFEALRLEGRLLAEEPRLKAVAATDEIDHETAIDVVMDLKIALGVSLLLLTDAKGHLLADATAPDAAGDDVSDLPLIAEALTRREAIGVLRDERGAYQACARTVMFGTSLVGVVLVGRAIDDKSAARASRHTGTTVVVVNNEGTVLALANAEERIDRNAAKELLALNATEASYQGERFIIASKDYPLQTAGLRYALMRSLDRALAPGKQLARALLFILFAGLIVSVGAASWLSGRISRPLNALASFAGRIGRGDFRAETIHGPSEVRTLADAMNDMSRELAQSRTALVEKERIEKELEIAARIQTAILPRNTFIESLEIAASMVPASEVGGDYYDVLPAEDGCWIGFGDVAGHGVPAGMVMVMIQSMVAALARREMRSPRALVSDMNAVLYDNVRNRLQQDEHATFVLLRVYHDGRVLHAGAHEDIIVCPQSGPCKRVATTGSWVGAMQDVADVTTDTPLQLQQGDLLLLYSDGITEAMNDTREQYGIIRLVAALERSRELSVDDACDAIMADVRAFTLRQDDDMTLLLARYVGPMTA